MSEWNFDMSQAPRGKNVTEVRRIKDSDRSVSVFKPDSIITASKCGRVIKSHFLPEANRWLMYAAGEQPIAWQPWPEHPGGQP